MGGVVVLEGDYGDSDTRGDKAARTIRVIGVENR